MKRIFSFFVMIIMIASMNISVFANGSESTETSKMESVLHVVKQKIDVPSQLTEFKPSTRENVKTGKTTYVFSWHDEEGSASLQVSSDDEGRIIQYYFYDSSLQTTKKLTALSKTEIIDYADGFLKKTLPEAFENENDILVFNEESWFVNDLNYNLEYIRIYNGIEVKDNKVALNIHICDDVPYVRNMSVSLNYNSEFESVTKNVEDYIEKYKEAFPIELIYRDDIEAYWKIDDQNEKQVETILVYRHKNNEFGFILAETGEIAEEDNLYELYGGSGGGVTNEKFEAAADAAARKEIFTTQELAELEKIQSLISKDGLRRVIEKIPHIGYNDDLEMSNYGIYFYDTKYIIGSEFRNEDTLQYISVSVDGVSGEVNSLRSYMPSDSVYDNVELTESEKDDAKKKTDEFLKIVAGEKLSMFALQNDENYSKLISRSYDRVVNGVRYISDRMSVSFDAKTGYITNYDMDFATDRKFRNPDGIISADAAYDAIIELDTLKKMYVHTGGCFKVCYTIGGYGTEIDAFTGEKYVSPHMVQRQTEYEYSDLDGHWAEKIIRKLAESQIGFNGEKFMPDEPINQLDLLRIFAAATRNSYYLTYSEKNIYDIFIGEGILSESEKNPSENVRREDAFVYLIRLSGLDEVAKLHNIFKVEYSDKDLIGNEKIGYPAILTGMGIICGDGGELRPKDVITRAEAAVMVYKYMMK